MANDVDTRAAARTSGDQPTRDAVRVAKALADPTRLRMLQLMAAGRSACCTPSRVETTPPDPGAEGICVCEFQAMFGLAQSRTSYHLRVLRDAGLVSESTRGKWSFCTVDRERLAASLDLLTGAAGLPAATTATPPDGFC